MVKLFSKEEVVTTLPRRIQVAPVEGIESLNTASEEFMKGSLAFDKINALESLVATENYALITPGNYTFYNDYIKTISSNLGVDIPMVKGIAFESMDIVGVNRGLALEGFMADIWKKIKAGFGKLIEKIKAFFKRFFTRLGRVKARLNNIKEVLDETTKDLSKSVIEECPSNVKSFYPTVSTISLSTVTDTIANTESVINELKAIEKLAAEVAKENLIPTELITDLKDTLQHKDSLVDKQTVAVNKKEATLAGKSEIGKLATKAAATVINNDYAVAKGKVADIGKEMEKTAKTEAGIRDKIDTGTSDVNIPDDGKANELISISIKKFNKSCDDILKKLDKKHLAKGKTVVRDKKTASDEELSLFTIETDSSSEATSSVSLANRTSLINLISDSISLLETYNQFAEAVGKTIDVFNDNISKIDKAITTIDSLGDKAGNSLNTYKQYNNKVIKPKLNKFRQIFVGFNKVSSNFIDSALDACEGSINYCVLSLKYFG